ncbi:MAG: chromosomal replication initiator protein DnaA [Sedimentisphaerales bacterium]
MQGTITDESSRTVQAPVSKTSQVANAASAIHEALLAKIGEQKYRIWFKNSTKLTLAGGYLKIAVPNLFIASWIENHFLNEINQAVEAAIGSKLKITFTIDPELHSRSPALDTRGWVPPVSSGRRQERRDSLSSTEQMAKGGKRFATCDKQLKLTLDTFVVGPSNELAYNAAKAVVNQKHCPFNPLFIHGGYGLGKTHLLQGICNELAKSRPETNWLYMSAEDFTNQFVLALKLKKLEVFRRRMRQTDLLAIDDIHFLANKPSTQEEFLHTFNTINLAGKQVVLVSDAHPKMIGQLSEKLISRFVSGMVVKIEPPNFQTRCQICRQFLDTRRESRIIPESVVRYIAGNLRTNVRELEGALLKLIAYSALQNEKITLSMAQAVLADHLQWCDPIVRISDIESAVAAYFGQTVANLHSAKKDRTVALARHFSMYLTRKHTKMSSSEIGRFMGNKNHATVLLACKKVEQLIKQDSDVHWQGPTGNKIAKARTILTHLEENISS